MQIICPGGAVLFLSLSLSSLSSLYLPSALLQGIPGGSAIKTLTVMEDSIPGWETSSGGGHGNPRQYSCLENPFDRGTWRATVHRVTKSRTRQLTEHARFDLNFLSCFFIFLEYLIFLFIVKIMVVSHSF